MNPRVERVAEEVRAAIAAALLSEIQDPRLALVSINAVRMTPNLEHGRVYWNLIATEPDPRAIEAASRSLDRSVGRLRKYVGKAMRLRVVPTLDFVHDDSIERGRRLSAIIDSLEIPDEES